MVGVQKLHDSMDGGGRAMQDAKVEEQISADHKQGSSYRGSTSAPGGRYSREGSLQVLYIVSSIHIKKPAEVQKLHDSMDGGGRAMQDAKTEEQFRRYPYKEVGPTVSSSD